MTFRPWPAVLVASALAIIALAFFGPGSRQKKPSVSSAAAFGPVNSSPAASASEPPEPPAPPRLPFVFDCQSLAPAVLKPCGALPTEEQALLDLANMYRMPPLMALYPELAVRAKAVLAAARTLDPQKLAPLEKAALQNATFSLLVRSAAFEKSQPSHEITDSVRALLKKLALSRAEIAKLPVAASVVPEWLGDAADWHQGTDTAFMHTASDGYGRAHRQLQSTNAVADVVRMVLVNDTGAPYVSDTVQRIVVRRTAADAVHVCIAELDPLSASCSTPGAVRALEPAKGASVIKPQGGASCPACHTNNTPKALPYGSTTGFQLSDTSASRILAIARRTLTP